MSTLKLEQLRVLLLEILSENSEVKYGNRTTLLPGDMFPVPHGTIHPFTPIGEFADETLTKLASVTKSPNIFEPIKVTRTQADGQGVGPMIVTNHFHNKPMPLTSVLFALAGQEGNNGDEGNAMQAAAEFITAALKGTDDGQ